VHLLRGALDDRIAVPDADDTRLECGHPAQRHRVLREVDELMTTLAVQVEALSTNV